MKRYEVINKRGVHSMAAGRSWYKGHFVLEGQVPEYLIMAWLKDGAVVDADDDNILCAGLTAKGEPCKRKPLDDSEYCKTHQPAGE